MTRNRMKYALEDYIHDMETGSLQPTATEECNMDVYAQLQQKEKDLILAAELGKALLEKNEELTRQNDRLIEEYSLKLEMLEQDRHILRRKLEATQSDYETRIIELQTDITELRRSQEQSESAFKQVEKEKTLLITELSEQNLRLTTQLKESSRAVDLLSSQMQCLKNECHMKKSSLQDHASSLEMLREEIQLLSEKKTDMERRMQVLQTERDILTGNLEEATDRIVMLEQNIRDHEMQVLQYQRELEQLQAENIPANERLSSSGHSSINNSHRSLLHEMECVDDCISDVHMLKDEILAACRQLHQLYEKLTYGIVSPSASEASCKSLLFSQNINHHNYKIGTLLELAKVLSSLVTSKRPGTMELEIQLHDTQEQLERLQQLYDSTLDKLKQHAAHIMNLESKLSVQEMQLKCLAEERDQARADVADTRLAQDDVVCKAWEARDKAVARKNQLEVELAKTRIEMMQANSQLMEAIQQKVELSEQLDQWQMDVQCLLDDQMKNKLSAQELRSQLNTSDYESCGSNGSSNEKKRNPQRRIFGIFQR